MTILEQVDGGVESPLCHGLSLLIHGLLTVPNEVPDVMFEYLEIVKCSRLQSKSTFC